MSLLYSFAELFKFRPAIESLLFGLLLEGNNSFVVNVDVLDVEIHPGGAWLLEVNSHHLAVRTIEVLIEAALSQDIVPVLRITLEVRIAHQLFSEYGCP